MPLVIGTFARRIESFEVSIVKKAAARLKKPSFYGCILFLLVFGIALASPGTVTKAASDGLHLCGEVVIPSLFPFFVLANLFVGLGYHRNVAAVMRPLMKPLFGLRGAAAGALVLGAAGGYPIGAATVFRLYDRGELNAAQASRALAFCNNAGPGFLLGVVGISLLGSVRLGLLLWGIHLLSALLVGIFFRRPDSGVVSVRSNSDQDGKPSFPTVFVESIADGAGTMVRVCGFLIFFSVVLAFLQQTPLWQWAATVLPAGAALLDGMVELSTGVGHLITSNCSQLEAMTCSAFLLGWGGLCVHCQVLSLKGRRAISMAPYWSGKFLQGLLSAALVRLIAAPSPLSLVSLLLLVIPAILFRKVRTGKQALFDV